jgi:hypothetical protein
MAKRLIEALGTLTVQELEQLRMGSGVRIPLAAPSFFGTQANAFPSLGNQRGNTRNQRRM